MPLPCSPDICIEQDLLFPDIRSWNEALVAINPEIIKAMDQKAPMGRIGEPEEVAAAAIFLCSDEASCITGHALPVYEGIVAD